MAERRADQQSTGPSVFIVSGGVGAVGEQIARTVLAQFPDAEVPIRMYTRFSHIKRAEDIIDRALASGGIILHTLVDSDLRSAFQTMADEKGVIAIDGIGPFMAIAADWLGLTPVGKPGLYRLLHESYFKRIEAIDFSLAHDDGKNFQTWHQAEIVLLGVSRVGKTPISLYLSMLGWKVANIPIVPGIVLRPELQSIPKIRLVGLTIDPGQLVLHRRYRQLGLTSRDSHSYVDPESIFEELTAAEASLKRAGIAVINVTDKPIETSAGQILDLLNRRLRSAPADLD